MYMSYVKHSVSKNITHRFPQLCVRKESNYARKGKLRRRMFSALPREIYAWEQNQHRHFTNNFNLQRKISQCRFPKRAHCVTNDRHVILPCSGQNGNIIKNKVHLLHISKEYRREIDAIKRILLQSSLLKSFSVPAFQISGHSRLFSTSSRCFKESGKEDEKDEKQDDRGPPPLSTAVLWFLLIFFVYSFLLGLSNRDQAFDQISWNEFYYDILAKGEVEKLIINTEEEVAIVKLHQGAVIKGKRVEVPYYRMKILDLNTFEQKVTQAEKDLGISTQDAVPIEYHRSNGLSVLAVILAAAALYFVFRRSNKMKVSMSNPSEMFFANERKAKYVRVDTMTAQGKSVSFKDVAGLKEAKIEVLEFVDYLKHPARYQELGAKIPRGALLLGPPGCGKTLLARAVATEARVPFLAMAGSEFVEMIGGLGAARVRDLFKEARKNAPCIIYLDEIDAIGRKRGGSAAGGNDEEDHTLNQLLVEMDGMGTQKGVIVLASTNRADILDKAILRPGRFDRHITIDLPTMVEREEIFEMYLEKLKLSQPKMTYAPRLAQLTPGMSGADIANICNEAAIHAARETKKTIEAEDFDYAVERSVAGVAKKSRLLSPSEKKIVAYHETGHALMGWLLKHTDALLRVSIVPRTNSALGFAQYIPSDQKLYSTEELFERMCMALGGRAAEAIIFNHITTGAQDDLQKVTKLAYNQIRSYGMNERVGYLSFPDNEKGGIRPYSKQLAQTIDQEARNLVNRAYRNTEKILLENKEKLHLVASTLLEKEVLTYQDMKDLIGAPPHGEKKAIEPKGWGGIMPNDNGQLDTRKRGRKSEDNNDL